MTVHEVDAISPDESALHIPEVSALAVADGVVGYDGLRFVSDGLMDDPEETKAGLRAAYARLSDELYFENLLVAHGDPVVGGRPRRAARVRLRLTSGFHGQVALVESVPAGQLDEIGRGGPPASLPAHRGGNASRRAPSSGTRRAGRACW